MTSLLISGTKWAAITCSQSIGGGGTSWNIKWPVSRAEGTNIKAFGV